MSVVTFASVDGVYRRARLFVIAASLAVALAAILILRAFSHHVTVPCQGVMERIDSNTLSVTHSGAHEPNAFFVDFDVKVVKKIPQRTNYRVRWIRTDGPRACNDLSVPHRGKDIAYSVEHVSADLYGVYDEGGDLATAFRTVDRSGRAFDHEKLVDAHDLGLIILLGGFGALTLAAFRLLHARGYARRMHGWTPATLRADGIVESETGAMIARLGAKVRRYGEDILVKNVEKADAYRDMPILEKGDFAFGTHALWERATYRRLRDARVLAVIAVVTTFAAVLANQFAG